MEEVRKIGENWKRLLSDLGVNLGDLCG